MTSYTPVHRCLCAGLMLPWGSDPAARPTCIVDRFHLGGPSTLRGFSFKGVGPTAERRAPRTAATAAASTSSSAVPEPSRLRDALGGDLYTSILAAVRSSTGACASLACDTASLHLDHCSTLPVAFNATLASPIAFNTASFHLGL